MKSKKNRRWSILGSLLAVSVITLTVPFVVSCSSVSNNTSNKNTSTDKDGVEHDKTSSTSSPSLNENDALPIGSSYHNGSLSNLSASWNNFTSGAISVDESGEVSLSTSAPSGSTIQYYVSNSDAALLTTSQEIDQTTLSSSGTVSFVLPSSLIAKLNTFTYYIFAIIKNADATYPVQTSTAVINYIGSAYLKITNGLLKNTSGVSSACENSQIEISLAGAVLSSIKDSSALTYSWLQINHATSDTVSLPSTTDTLTYPTLGAGYITIQCNISQDGKIIYSPMINFYVSAWGNLVSTNSNISDGILTVKNTDQSLSASIENSFIPSNTTINYQWYKKGINANNLTDNLNFTAVANATSTTYALTDIMPTYTTEYKVTASFAYNGTVHTLASNIVQVYYNSSVGNVDIAPVANTITNGIVTINNGESVELTANLSKLAISSDLVSFQWQKIVNGSWTNISNATTDSYTVTEKNSSINTIRLMVSLPQNWNDGTIYSNNITVQTPAISSELSDEIYNKAAAYFNDSTNFSNVWMSYFMNSNNSNYWWLWDSLLAGWWKENGGFYTSSDGKSFSAVTLNNILACFKLTSISVINGSFNNAKPTGSPRLVFNFEVIANNVYIKTGLGSISMPEGYSFEFSSPIYISNVDGESSGYSFSVASNGSVSYTITNSLGNQTNMKYYWNGVNSAWGLNFTGSVYDGLKSQGFFNYQTTNSHTVLYNWLNAPSSIVINNDTAPAMPNFYNEIVNAGVTLNLTPSQTSSQSEPIAFTHNGLTLSVKTSLSNGGTLTNLSYSWTSQKVGSSEIENIDNTTDSYSPTYPTTAITTSYIVIYKVTVVGYYNGNEYTASVEFYVNYLPTDSSTNN